MLAQNNVFIATLPRSGSTLLGMILGAHSKIAHIGESSYWSKINTASMRCCCGNNPCQTLLKIAIATQAFPDSVQAIHDTFGMIDITQEPGKIRHFLSLGSNLNHQMQHDQDLLFRNCIDGLNAICDIARTVFGKEFVIENSKYIQIADHLLATKKWKVVIVTRDPRGVAFSSKKAGIRKNVPRPISEKIDVISAFANTTLHLMEKENVFLLRYEDLCQSTTETLEHLCDFIGVTFESQMLEFKRYKGHLLMGNHMMHDSNEIIREDRGWEIGLTKEERILFTTEMIIQPYRQLGYCIS